MPEIYIVLWAYSINNNLVRCVQKMRQREKIGKICWGRRTLSCLLPIEIYIFLPAASVKYYCKKYNLGRYIFYITTLFFTNFNEKKLEKKYQNKASVKQGPPLQATGQKLVAV